MKKNLLKLSFLLVLGVCMAACAPDPQDEPTEPMVKDGTFTNFSASRDTVTRFQPILFSGEYTPSKNVAEDNITFSCKLTVNGKESAFPQGAPQIDYNILGLSFKVNDCYVGDCVLTFTITEKVGGDMNQLSSSVKFTVVEGKPAIRNSNWDSNTEDCKLDISYYGINSVIEVEQGVSTPGLIEFKEKDDYIHTWSENPEVTSFKAVNRRVSYGFLQNKLLQVEYTILPDNANADLVAALMERIPMVQKPYYGFKNLTFEVQGNTSNLSLEAQALLEKFKAGTLKSDDANRTLHNALMENKGVSLTAFLDNADSLCSFWLDAEEGDLKLTIVFINRDAWVE